jgi:hypothetical protein
MLPITAAEVQALLNTPFSEPDLLSSIEEAALLLGDCGNQYDDSRRRVIIKWLAGHLLTSRLSAARGNLKSESIDGISYTTNTAQVGMGLKGTALGQMALSFDKNGCLQDLDRPAVVFMAI